MGGSSPKQPKPQDPTKAIELQARYNRVGQVTPFGSARYVGDETNGYNVETTLSPGMQGLVDRGMRLAGTDSERYQRPQGFQNLMQAIQGRVANRYGAQGSGGRSAGLPSGPSMEYDFQPQVSSSTDPSFGTMGGGKVGQGYAQQAPSPVGGVSGGGYMAKPTPHDYSQAPQGAGPAAPGTSGIDRLNQMNGIGAMFGTGGMPTGPRPEWAGANMISPQNTGAPVRNKPQSQAGQPSPGVPPGP